MDIVHVTEAFGGGVASAIRDYVRNHPGSNHHLIYAERADAPISPHDTAEFVSATPFPVGHLNRVRWLRKRFALSSETIVHAHSSLAGGYVRLALRNSQRRPIVYTPHCYSFERRDISATKRAAFRAMEWLLAFNTAAVAACSLREAHLSRWIFARPNVVFVPNVPPHDLESVRTPESRGGRLLVAGAGRLGKQKDPGFFIAAIAALREAGIDVDAMWVGGGDASVTEQLLSGGVSVTGWRTRADAVKLVRSADVYVHSAAWEGFPVALLESVSMGVATVARAIPALDGVGLPIVIAEPQDLVGFWPDLQSDDRRAKVVKQCREALSDYSESNQRAALNRLYDGLDIRTEVTL